MVRAKNGQKKTSQLFRTINKKDIFLIVFLFKLQEYCVNIQKKLEKDSKMSTGSDIPVTRILVPGCTSNFKLLWVLFWYATFFVQHMFFPLKLRHF